MAFLGASVFSATLVPFAGAVLDHYGALQTAVMLTPVYISFIVFTSYVHNARELALCLAIVRFLGPDCLVLIALTTVQRWFVRLRGRAMAVLFLSRVVLLSLPALMTALIDASGSWRKAYRTLAVLIAVIMLLGLSLLRDEPATLGLRPDGDGTTGVKSI
jgi:hypothetical protein